MQEISPFLLSAWRLSLTAILLLPVGVYQIVKLSTGMSIEAFAAYIMHLDKTSRIQNVLSVYVRTARSGIASHSLAYDASLL